MTFSEQLAAIKSLAFDLEEPVFNNGELEVYILRPSKLSKRFTSYDPKKNFQIWLRDGERKFRPNHLRVFIDLYLRVRSRPDLKKKLARAFDDIFHGAAPEIAITEIGNENFEHFLNSLGVTACLSQLFIIEQAHGYHRESNYDPRTLFYQGWVRQIIDSDKEIDNLIMSISRGQPPAAKYTFYDDKNHKKYTEKPSALWWLG